MKITDRINKYLEEDAHDDDLMVNKICSILTGKGRSCGSVEKRKIADMLKTDKTTDEIVKALL